MKVADKETTSRHSQADWGKILGHFEEAKFLEGPASRLHDWYRAFSIFSEFIRGFRTLRKLGPSVTIFGSARVAEDSSYYELARTVARALGEQGFTIITGGGPGVMEAANRGARDVGAHSVGCNIVLPKEQQPNPYLDTWVEFNYFFVRKVMLVKYSSAFVVLPGGFGTLDEVFETATLIQTGKIEEFPIVAVGSAFWSEMREFLVNTVLAEGMISEKDLEHVHLTDDPGEICSHICGRIPGGAPGTE